MRRSHYVTIQQSEWDRVEREAFLRGHAAGKKEAALEAEYGSFSGLVQTVMNAATEYVAAPADIHKETHAFIQTTGCPDCQSERLARWKSLKVAIAAYDAKYPPDEPSTSA